MAVKPPDSTPIWRFLADLGRDPRQLLAFEADPDAVLAGSGLDEPARAALRTRDVGRILAAIANEDAVATPAAAPAPAPLEAPAATVGDGSPGRLTIVGVGLKLGAHVTAEAEAVLRAADDVLYLVTDPANTAWLRELNPTARSLAGRYEEGKDRAQIYAELVDDIASAVTAGRHVCFAIYGHPGVLVMASHDVTQRLRERGVEVRMQPGISAEACLLADLGYDSGQGLQSYEATEFLVFGKTVDLSTALVLWQIGVIGMVAHATEPDPERIAVLADRLSELYGPDHPCTVYEAAFLPGCEPLVRTVPVRDLPGAATMNSTLFVPPREPCVPDLEVAAAIGLPVERLRTREPWRPST